MLLTCDVAHLVSWKATEIIAREQGMTVNELTGRIGDKTMETATSAEEIR